MGFRTDLKSEAAQIYFHLSILVINHGPGGEGAWGRPAGTVDGGRARHTTNRLSEHNWRSGKKLSVAATLMEAGGKSKYRNWKAPQSYTPACISIFIAYLLV